MQKALINCTAPLVAHLEKKHGQSKLTEGWNAETVVTYSMVGSLGERC